MLLADRPDVARALPGGLLRFVRHGATAANLAGLRCGGDLDVPLTDIGRQQGIDAGRRIAQLAPSVGVIVTSDLQRTRETAALIAASLPGVPVVIEPAFAERRLGEWNLRSIESTRRLLEACCTPPGGESNAEFIDRVARALRMIKGFLVKRPLLVGSKGVARVMAELIGLPRLELGNGVVTEFDLTSQACLQTSWSGL